MTQNLLRFQSEMCGIVLCCALMSGLSCAHSAPATPEIPDTAMAPLHGPRIISRRPSVDTPEYYVELKPEFDQVKYSFIIAKRVGGKVGYIYDNFHGFTVHSIPDSMADKMRAMPEVSKVVKSQVMTID